MMTWILNGNVRGTEKFDPTQLELGRRVESWLYLQPESTVQFALNLYKEARDNALEL